MQSIINIDHLTCQYSDQIVLKDISLQIPNNKWITIVGKNGSGKSTLVKAIDGLIDIKSGNIVVNGYSLKNDLSFVRNSIGIMFQNPDSQFVGATVADDIAFGLENKQYSQLKMDEVIDKVLDVVNMNKYKNTAPNLLSGGQKQRVALAGIIAMGSPVIILDEATSMIDPNGRKIILNILKKLIKQGKTVISVTHDSEEIAKSDYVIGLDNKNVIYHGSPSLLFENLELLDKLFLGKPLSLRILDGLKSAKLLDKKDNYAYLDDEKVMQLIWKLYLKM